MDLRELGMSYLFTAAALSLAIQEREQLLREDPARGDLTVELRLLRAMRKDVREVGSYALHYRDRSFCRNGMCAAWPDR